MNNFDESIPLTTAQMIFFGERERKHYNLVYKYANKIIDYTEDNISRYYFLREIFRHDHSKYNEQEHLGYLHIDWKYFCKTQGIEYKVSEDIEKLMLEATFTHVKNNNHHPEYWDPNCTIDCINKTNRDSPSNYIVDATKMPKIYVAIMLADWLAVSDERDTNIDDWVKNNVNIRWKFTDEQVEFIKDIVEKVKE